MLVKDDKEIIKILQEKPFTFSCEFVPPRNGESLKSLFQKTALLKEAGIDFLSVTKGAGGSLRGGTVPIAFLIKEKYKIPVIAHFTCMESTLQEIENSLIDHSYLGVINILALRGDPPTGVFSEYVAKENEHQYAYQLIKQVNGLKTGKYILRKGFDNGEANYHQGEPLHFCIGAAAYPGADKEETEKNVDYFIQKINEGAEYGITQMTYSPESYKAFIDGLAKKGHKTPILPGIRILGTYKQAEFLINNFKIDIPKEYLEVIKTGDDQLNKKYIIELIMKFRAAGAKGIQFFIMNEAAIVADVVRDLTRPVPDGTGHPLHQ